MSLIYTNGFDYINTYVDAVNGLGSSISATAGDLNSCDSEFTFVTATRTNFAGKMAQVNAGGGVRQLTRWVNTPLGTCIAGCAVKCTGSGQALIGFADIVAGSLVWHLYAYINPTLNRVEIWKSNSTTSAPGDTLLGTSFIDSFVQDKWYYLEMQVTIGSTGSAALFIDGIVAISLTNVNTVGADTSHHTVGGIALGIYPNEGTAYFDDFYISDTHGEAPYNTFLGSILVYTVFPKSDVVDGFAKSDDTAAGNFAMVNSNSNDGGSTYNQSAASALAEDIFNIQQLPIGLSPIAVVTKLVADQVSTGAYSLRTLLINSGNEVFGATPASGHSGYQTQYDVWETAPFSSSKSDIPNAPWTVRTVNTTTLGYEVGGVIEPKFDGTAIGAIFNAQSGHPVDANSVEQMLSTTQAGDLIGVMVVTEIPSQPVVASDGTTTTSNAVRISTIKVGSLELSYRGNRAGRIFYHPEKVDVKMNIGFWTGISSGVLTNARTTVNFSLGETVDSCIVIVFALSGGLFMFDTNDSLPASKNSVRNSNVLPSVEASTDFGTALVLYVTSTESTLANAGSVHPNTSETDWRKIANMASSAVINPPLGGGNPITATLFAKLYTDPISNFVFEYSDATTDDKGIVYVDAVLSYNDPGRYRVTQTFAEVVCRGPASGLPTGPGASQSFYGEGLAATIDFYPVTPAPDFGLRLDNQPRVNTTSEGLNYSQRALDGINTNLRQTTLTYTDISTGEKELLRQFLERHGATTAFQWIPPGDTNYGFWLGLKWSYKADNSANLGQWKFTVQMQEVVL